MILNYNYVLPQVILIILIIIFITWVNRKLIKITGRENIMRIGSAFMAILAFVWSFGFLLHFTGITFDAHHTLIWWEIPVFITDLLLSLFLACEAYEYTEKYFKSRDKTKG